MSSTAPDSHVIGSSVPGYTGHIPLRRELHGGTFGATGRVASANHMRIRERTLSKTQELRSTLAAHQTMTPVPIKDRQPAPIHEPHAAFTPRPYSRAIGTLPHSTVYVPQLRFRDYGLTHGMASRAGAELVHEASVGYNYAAGDPLDSVPSISGKSAHRKWIV